MASQNWDWIFIALGWTLAGLGVILALWALFWDRSRGRKRCPKCWYSMEGAVEDDDGAVTCPECGRESRATRKLLRTRRRRRAAMLAAFICLVGYGSFHTPAIKRYGWVAAAPTTILVVAASPTDFMASPSRSVTPKNSIADEILRRYHRHDVFHWQTDLLEGRVHSTGDEIGGAPELRSYDISDMTGGHSSRSTPPDWRVVILFGNAPSGSDANLIAEYRDDELLIANIIQSNVNFDDWIANGGNAAAMSAVPGQLIITATPELHEQVAYILMKLRGGVPEESGSP